MDFATVPARRFRAELGAHLESAAAGGRVVITHRGRPVAELVKARPVELSPWDRALAEAWEAASVIGAVEDVSPLAALLHALDVSQGALMVAADRMGGGSAARESAAVERRSDL